VDDLLHDLRLRLRILAKTPVVSGLALLCIALGVSATTSIFSVVNAVVLRPLPLKHVDRLAMITSTHAEPGAEPQRVAVSAHDYGAWRDQNRVFEAMGALENTSYNLTGGGGEPERVEGARVTADWLPTLGVDPVVGRVFLAEEDRAGAPSRVALVGYGLWQRRFGSDPGLVGRQIQIDDLAYTVVGVLPRAFEFPYHSEVWLPLGLDPNGLRQQRNLTVFARLRPGVGYRQARTDLDGVAARLASQRPANAGIGVDLKTMREELSGDIRPKLFTLLGAVVFVLLIACADVASLLLARAEGQTQAVAVRAAIGADRRRLIREHLAESLLLALGGGALGILLSLWAIRPLVALSPVATMASFFRDVRLDGTVLGFAFLLSLATGLVFGLVPALRASRPDVQSLLKEGAGRASAGRGGRRMLAALVVLEVAVAVVLLVGAGLMLKSFERLQRSDPGFRRDGVLTLRMVLPRARYQEGRLKVAFVDTLLERVRALPEVISAGTTSDLPVNINNDLIGFEVEGRAAGRNGEFLIANHRLVTPDYLPTLGVGLVAGRNFTAGDRGDTARVAVVSEKFVHRYWPGENPLGKRLLLGAQTGTLPVAVVGVVRDVKDDKFQPEVDTTLYLPFLQFFQSGPRAAKVDLVVRTRVEPLALASTLTRTIHGVDPELPVFQVETLGALVDDSLSQRRFNALLLGLFAGIGLILAAVGLYGVMSYSVHQRVREIGVRVALGAHPGDVQGMIVRQGLLLVLAGLAAGLAGALALSRLLASLLYEVSPADPVTFAGISLVLALVGLLATWLPARRATRVDPLVALRYE
jgi:putative ABC transport system permease protein